MQGKQLSDNFVSLMIINGSNFFKSIEISSYGNHKIDYIYTRWYLKYKSQMQLCNF